MRSAMAAFNSPDDDGRATGVLLHLQHAFEMLLKAALVQGGVRVMDKTTGRSISFEQSVRQAQQAARIRVKDDEAGTLRAIDALRDDEQHWFNEGAPSGPGWRPTASTADAILTGQQRSGRT